MTREPERSEPVPTRDAPAPPAPEVVEHPAPGVEHRPEPDAENIMPAEDRPGTF